ncbi:sorbin and SH3 domain-containing protein 1-like [Numida meleagris]|uniref:sorbin and SH3 domain-containing protein 1-like n=1 Tax=Numida meleagris TaxID=8996 RepID=UPI000B3D88AF|nr:sorbin and SH3 domain-containing protein 1-like [Numida meleagris]
MVGVAVDSSHALQQGALVHGKLRHMLGHRSAPLHAHSLSFYFCSIGFYFPFLFLFISLFFSSAFVSLKSPSSELLHTPTPPPLPFARRALSPEVQAVTSEWIALTVGVSPSTTPALTPPLPSLPEASLSHTDSLPPSTTASPSPSFSLPHSHLSGSSTPRSIKSPLPSYSSGPQPSTRSFYQAALQSKEKVGGSSSPCPRWARRSPESILTEQHGTPGSQAWLQKTREGSSNPEQGSHAAPNISVERCLKPSQLDMRASPERRPVSSTEDNQLCQELMAIVQGGKAEKRGTRRGDLGEFQSGEKKVLLLHVCALL